MTSIFMQKLFSKISPLHIGGTLVFILSLSIYVKTLAPALSFWDCGEFIACANGLEVGHAPGAPVYLILARAISALTPLENVAYVINLFSAIVSALTILILYSTSVKLLDKISNKQIKNINIVAAGISSLSFAFTDSFWFSAVEAEVYALSLFFTAFTVWAALKWESEYPNKSAHRWLLLISFCLGLSVGVHLLNLLTVPVVVYWVLIHIKKEDRFKHVKALGLGIITLVFVQFIFVQNGLYIAKYAELLFVNTLGLPVHSGLLFFIFGLMLLLAVLIYLMRDKNQLAQFALTATLLFFIGLSSYATVIIRANAGTGINLNNPSHVFSLESFINREQYGERPLFRGAWFGAKRKDVEPIYNYRLNPEGKYERYQQGSELVYDSKDKSWVQRMYSSQQHHVRGYKHWTGIDQGERPTLLHQLEFLFKYQLGHMYFRYFMWNFSGRQNHYQGHGDFLHGNFITGIPLVDKNSLGSRQHLHAKELVSPGRNNYFMLPLLFGLVGVYMLVRKKKKDVLLLIGSLFLLTGVAIAFYLNQPPFEPRERDYVFVGSFYAFSIFIAVGIWSVLQMAKKRLESNLTSSLVAVFAAVALPGMLISNNFDDHSRSGRTLARDLAKGYLSCCEPNAILFTYGDNDTYPLWYMQEVEGFRRDVRVVNLGLLSADWYIKHLTLAQNECEPLRFSVPMDKYKQGNLDYAAILNRDNSETGLTSALEFLASNQVNTKLPTKNGGHSDFLPNDQFYLDDEIKIEVGKSYVMKGEIALLDIIASNFPQRPICFANGTPKPAMLGLAKYLRPYGMVGKLNYKSSAQDNRQLYDLLINKIHISLPQKSWCDETCTDALQLSQLHETSVSLANALCENGEEAKAKDILNKYYPVSKSLLVENYKSSLPWVETLFRCGLNEKAFEAMDYSRDIASQNLNFYIHSQDLLGENMLIYAKEEQEFTQKIAQFANRNEAVRR